MSSARSKPNPSRTLAKARELVSHHQAIVHHLLPLQSKLAGLLPRPRLDELYLANEISPEEYVEMLIAQGWSSGDAHAALIATHLDGAPPHWTEPTPPKETIDWSRLGRPGRRPTRPTKDANGTSGHPLENLE